MLGSWRPRARLARDAGEPAYRSALALVQNACAIAEGSLPLALSPWKTPDVEGTPTWFHAAIPKEIAKFTSVIEKRQTFLQELSA